MYGWLVVAQVVLTLLHWVAIASALFRLHRRRKIDQLDWDDYIAGLALALNIIYFPTLWFPNDKPFVIDRATNRKIVTITIVDSWLFNLVWGLLLWATRISVGLSITRAFPKRTRYYYASLALVFALVAATIAIEVLCVAKCAVTYATWSVTPPYQCYGGFPSYVAFACLDVLSDLMLVIVPLWALWDKTNLTTTGRRVIKIGFAANGLTAVASLVTGVVIVGHYVEDLSVAIRVTSHIMSAISILACNSLVVVTSLYRHFRTKTNVPSRLPYPPPRLRELTDNTAQNSNSTGPTNTTDYTNTISVDPSAYTDNHSEPLTSQGSLRLTLTVVRTDPSSVFHNEVPSCANQTRLYGNAV